MPLLCFGDSEELEVRCVDKLTSSLTQCDTVVTAETPPATDSVTVNDDFNQTLHEIPNEVHRLECPSGTYGHINHALHSSPYAGEFPVTNSTMSGMLLSFDFTGRPIDHRVSTVSSSVSLTSM